MGTRNEWINCGLSLCILNLGLLLLYMGQFGISTWVALGLFIELPIFLLLCHIHWFCECAKGDSDCFNPLQLEAHEKAHEKKRHVQIAIALAELGEKEQALQYLKTVMKEIS